MNPDDQLVSTLGRLFQLEDPKHWPERGLLLVNSAEASVRVVQPEPCECHPEPEAGRFPAGDTDCNDADNAARIIFAFNNLDFDEVDALSPEDLKNVACALIWRKEATADNARQAYDLLKQARDAADGETRARIAENLKRFEAIEPGVPQPLAVFERLVYNMGHTLTEMREWMVERADLNNE